MQIVIANSDVSIDKIAPPKSTLRKFVPSLLISLTSEEIESRKDILKADKLLLILYQHISLLFSFGICAPYVALMCVVSVCLYWIKALSLISRYIILNMGSMQDVNDAKASAIQYLNETSTDVFLEPYYDWCLFLFFMCGMLVGLLYVDMAADESSMALSGDMIFLLAPLLFALVGEIVRRKFYRELFSAEEIKTFLSFSIRFESNLKHGFVEMNPMLENKKISAYNEVVPESMNMDSCILIIIFFFIVLS